VSKHEAVVVDTRMNHMPYAGLEGEEQAKIHKAMSIHIHQCSFLPSDSPNLSKAYVKKAGEEVKNPISA
jgi:hypothetical protein